jgi:hypothetical protein
METAPKELLALLKNFKGRPKFFFSFLEKFLETLRRLKCTTVEDLFSEMTKTAKLSLKDEIETMKKKLAKYVMDNRSFGGSTEGTTRKLVAQIFVASVLGKTESFKIYNKIVNQDIATHGLMLMSSANEYRQIYQKVDESIFFAALEELALSSQLDFVSEYFASPCTIIEDARCTKKEATTHLIAWYFIKNVRLHGSQSLRALLDGITPPNFTLLDQWRRITVETQCGWPASFDIPSTDVIDLINN